MADNFNTECFTKKSIIMKKGLIVILALVALFAIWGVKIYNSLVSKQETV